MAGATRKSSTSVAASNGAQANGDGVSSALVEAIAYEQTIADEAAAIRGEEFDGGLSPALFLKLLPLLRKPIPTGFIEHVEKGTGKPYASTGVRSVQVQVDRMDNVLTPLCWDYRYVYEEDGKLCEVTVDVKDGGGQVLVSRASYGGVNQANTEGNRRKGSFTNAAKRAFALVGPGHEVYLGAADFDPDTDKHAADLQTPAAPAVERVDSERAAGIRELFNDSRVDPERFRMILGSVGVVGASSVNAGIGQLTPEQASDVEAALKAEAQKTAGGES